MNAVYVSRFSKQDFKFRQHIKIFSSPDHSKWIMYDSFTAHLNMCLSEAWKLEFT